MLSLVPALAVAGLSVGGGLAALQPPPERGEMAVVFAPWVGEAEAFNSILVAGGRLVGPSRFSNIAIAFAFDEDFAARIRDAGAWFTLAATGLCGPLPATSKDTAS